MPPQTIDFERAPRQEIDWSASCRRWVVVIIGSLLFVCSAYSQTTAPTTLTLIRPTTAPAATVVRPATAPAARPTAAVDWKDCSTSSCHANIKQFKVLHGPVNVDACNACHKVEDEKRHTFTLQHDKTATCTFCHQVQTADMPVVHKPLTEGDCLGCHNPHGGTTKAFIRGNNMKELCVRCHEDTTVSKKMVHGPVAAGACGSCHQSHASKNKGLLVATGTELCLTCHAEMKTQMAEATVKHKAVEQDCSTCHDAHASNFPKQTRQSPKELCTSCHEHENVKHAAENAKFKHTVVTADDSCLNCHTAHGGDRVKLMRADPIKVCMKCHAEPIVVSPEKTIPAVADAIDPNTIKHGPIREGTCNGCHNVHGSDTPRLLAKEYPEKFYQPFSLDKYELCFTCHDKQLVLTQKTEGLTNFRNGTSNLHYLHVNKSDRGRSCYACHNTHASKHELHVRESVPYGNWNMPISFVKSETGGTCSPGCHKEYKYDRNQPVNYEQPTTQPAGNVAKGLEQ